MSTLKEKQKENNKPTTKDTLHKHASNTMQGLSNFMSNVNKKNEKNQATKKETIQEQKLKKETPKQKALKFTVNSIKTIIKILFYTMLSAEFITMCEFYKTNLMVGTVLTGYPYIDESKMKGIKKTKEKLTTKQQISNYMSGNYWSRPYKNPITESYPNTKEWTNSNWVIYYIVIIIASTFATGRSILSSVYRIGGAIWEPKSQTMNVMFMLLGGGLVHIGMIIVFLWGLIGTFIYTIMNIKYLENMKFSEKYEKDAGIYKFFIVAGILMFLPFGNAGIMLLEYFLLWCITLFMGSATGDYNFSNRIWQLLWKNKNLILILILANITGEAYEYIGKKAGYVFTGILVGLILHLIYKLATDPKLQAEFKADFHRGKHAAKKAKEGVQQTVKKGQQTVKTVQTMRKAQAKTESLKKKWV